MIIDPAIFKAATSDSSRRLKQLLTWLFTCIRPESQAKPLYLAAASLCRD
jgi:hypothetical protein